MKHVVSFFIQCIKQGCFNPNQTGGFKTLLSVLKKNRGRGELPPPPPLFLRNYTAIHPEIRYTYGSDHSDGLPIGSGTKYPELQFFRNFPESPEFLKFP